MLLRRPRDGEIAAIVSPSASGSQLSETAEARASKVLQSIGLTARPGLRMRSRGPLQAVDVQLRRMDIEEALEDPAVGVILATYGGYNAIDLVAHLPYELWKKTRKPLVGFSDITALAAALFARAGLPSLHGPNFATLGAPDLHPFTVEGLAAALFDPEIRLVDPGVVAEDIWFLKPEQQVRAWRPNRWRSLRGGRHTGRLLGGNLPTLLALAGTAYFPDLTDAVLLVECDIDNPIARIDRDLAQMGLLGAFTKAGGLIIGSCGSATDEQLPLLVEKHLSTFDGPILAGVNCSHVDPTATLPYGATLTLDADERTLLFESPFDVAD